MRLFTHISDFADGYASLPAMLVLSREVTVWAPSGYELEESHRRGSPICPKSFLRLVDRGSIRVLARDWWYEDRQRREDHPYPGARWMPSFDSALATMRNQDERYDLSERQVATFRKEAGPTWARRQISQETAAASRAGKRVAAKPMELPSGIREKARRAAAGPDRLLAVLRDVKNHDEAFRLSGAHMPAGPSLHAEAVPDILGSKPVRTLELEDSDQVTPERLVDTLRLLKVLRAKRLSRRRSFARLLCSAEMDDLRRELSAFLIADDKPVAWSLRSQVDKGLPARDVRLKRMVARGVKSDFYEDRLALTKAAVAIAGAGFAPQAALVSFLGRLGGTFRGLSLLPARDYTGPVWPFLIDGRRARYRSIERLIRELEDLDLPAI